MVSDWEEDMEWLLINPFVPFQVPGLSKIAKYAELYTGSDPRWDDYTNHCIMKREVVEARERNRTDDPWRISGMEGMLVSIP